ncbi:hypothetical protein FisN_23Lh102 [Fistulifera solaris]|uniref:Uncharacterized protein n=1 Tax=Fistulifera solaris TaxID=1519565 RepID=A0A1Z5KLX8_FISSO|nr:hypothetical protein FisN_23Lh102 [Fistulifera solaris]|eukprot:GAX27323.1 hypothetical protein FisN_23Lh102 [Fistulifera solaris]
MQIVKSSDILHRVNDHIQAAAALESLSIAIPVQNLAAIAVLEKTNQATSAEEKVNAFNSVIRTLEPKGGSSVLARALVMRSEFSLDSGRYQDALTDAKQALTMPTTIQVSRRAWRIQADAHTSLDQMDDALRCLQDWLNHDPAFRSKIGTEIERVRRLSDA